MSHKHDRSGRGRKTKPVEQPQVVQADATDVAEVAAPTLIERASAGLTASAEVLAMEVAAPPAIEVEFNNVEFNNNGAEQAPKQEQTKMVNETMQNLGQQGAEQVRQTGEKVREAGEQFRGAAQDAMGTMNAQAEQTMERNTRAMSQMGDLARGNMEAVVASTRIATEGFQALSREAAELGRRNFEGFSSTVKTLAEAKTPADVLRVQGEFARQSFDLAVSAGAQMSERMVKLSGEIAQPFQNRMAVAAETVKGAVAA